MRTTLDLDDHLLQMARQRAASEQRTLTSVVEDALRELLVASKARPGFRFEPIVVDGGEPFLVDVNDRDALYSDLDAA